MHSRRNDVSPYGHYHIPARLHHFHNIITVAVSLSRSSTKGHYHGRNTCHTMFIIHHIDHIVDPVSRWNNLKRRTSHTTTVRAHYAIHAWARRKGARCPLCLYLEGTHFSRGRIR